MELENLLELAVKRKASDLHIVPGLAPLLRINGILAPIKDAPILSNDETKQLLYTILTEPEQRLFEKKRVREMALTIPHIGNFRVSILHQLHGVAGVFRVVPTVVPSFEELSLPQVIKSLLVLSHGLILVAGPIGSGKTTTQAAMIDYINTYRACNIITIEDPIEYVHQSKRSIFQQVQIGRDTPDFATALRASLRQDPNVVLLGELRDLETMRLALTAAETGHLIIATLHATSAPIAISRFVDVFPAEEKNRVRNLLAETLQAVLFQTLVHTQAGARMAAFEIMLANTPIRHFIRQDMTAYMASTMQTNRDKGMCTLDQYLQELVEKQLISHAEAQKMMENRESFKTLHTGLSSRTDKKPIKK